MSLIDIVNYEMQTRSDRFWNSHTFFCRLRAGQVSQNQIASYLFKLGELVKQTPAHLAVAIRTCQGTDQNELGAHLEQKLREETGHEQWALNDIKSLQFQATLDQNGPRSTAVRAFVEWIFEQAASNMLIYNSYIYSVESITVYLGPRVLALMEAKAGVNRDQASVIAHHVELDVQHTAEMIPWMERLMNNRVDEQRLKPVTLAIDRTLKALGEILDEALTEGARPLETSAN